MDIFEVIRKQEENYKTGNTQISEHVSFSLKDNVERIDAYLNSKHISGERDSLGREKPFFNIVTSAVNVWYRATDIDRANIRIKATKSGDHTLATIANIHSQEWMRRSNFGAFLNEWGRTLVRYGSAVLKFVEQDGELTAQVIPWNRLIVDPVDFCGAPVIEKLYLTPAQLRRNKNYDQELVKKLIDQVTARETLAGQKKDTKADYIEVYEIHGELPLSLITQDEKDEETFVQQMHVCSFVAEKGTGGNIEYTDYSLYSGREEDPLMITHLIKEEGRTQAIGVVEHLFDAQWMVNHNEKAIKDQLDMASKIWLQTSDPSYRGKNMIALDTGSVLYHENNSPFTKVDNTSNDISSLMNSKTSWINQSTDAVSTPDALKGNTMPSNTAARQVEALQQEAHSLFELMTENKGIAIEEMWRRFVIPHLKKKLDTTDEIVATLDEQGIKQIDMLYVPAEARRRENNRVKQEMFALASAPVDEDVPFPTAPDTMSAEQAIKDEMRNLGSQRYLAPSDLEGVKWKDVLKDFEWDVEVEVTNESGNKDTTLVTLATLFKDLVSMGDVENGKLVFSKILEETGVFSPMELASAVPPTVPPTQT